MTPSKNWSSQWILPVVSLLAIVPVWSAHFPPMADLPQHAAQVALLKDLHTPRFAYAGLFHLNWFTPYLVGYLLIYVLVPLIGIVAACKAAVSLFVAGLPLSTGFLVSSVEVEPFWAILAIPCAFGFAYQWGFLNFLIAAPVGICFLACVIRSRRTPNPATAAFFAISVIVLFFCHALICGFFGLCAVLYIWRTSDSIKAAVLRVLPLTSVLPIALLWIHRTMANPAARRPTDGDWNWLVTTDPYYQSLSEELHFHAAYFGRLTGFTPNLLGMFPSWPHLCIAVALIVAPLCAGFRFRRRLANWLPLLVCIAVLLWCPLRVFGTDFVYQRFAMFTIPLFLLGLEPPERPAYRTLIAKSVALLLVAALVVAACKRAKTFNLESAGVRHALAVMQPGQRVLWLAFDHEDGVSIAPTFLQFGSWYAAEKQGIADPSAAMMHPELVLYHPEAIPPAVLWDFEWDPEEFDWDDYAGSQYRYFLARSRTEPPGTLFSHAPCPVRLRFHEDMWWLYERAIDCP